MKVLYANHTAITGGAEISLMDLIHGMPDGVSCLVACPEGDLASRFRSQGLTVEVIPPMEASLRLHPIQTPRGLAQIVRAGLQIRRVARRHRVDLVHANSIRAGMAAVIASAGGEPPVIVHIRDCLPDNFASNAIRHMMARGATNVLAISHHTAENFSHGNRLSPVKVIYESFDLQRFHPDRVARTSARRSLGVESDVPLVAVVGQITPWKGQSTAIQAFARVRERIGEMQLLIVGSVKFAGDATRYDNAAYLRSLHQLVDELKLEDSVSFVGERTDMPDVFGAIDILLTPSWEEPFGRVVVEAMAMETPVIATSIGGPAEVIKDGFNGMLVHPRETAAWAEALGMLTSDPVLRAQMGEKARRTAMTFSRDAHTDDILTAYEHTIARRALV